MREFLQNSRLFLRRLRLLALCFCILLLQPTVHAQANQSSLDSPVSIAGQNIPLVLVLKTIKKQTGFTFFYSNQLLDDKRKVSLSFRNARLEDVLAYLFKDKNISYEVRGNRLLLNEKPLPVKTAEEQVPSISDKKERDTVGIRGQVMDPDGKPLSGVSVIVSSTNKGAMTDEFGIFTLHASIGDTLHFSMVGMLTQVIRVANLKIIKVTLQSNTSKMDEAVVVGYGQQKKISVTGSVTSVNMEDMKTPVRNLTNALAGKVAGIISMQTSGEPGYDNSNFTIRGIGTFTGNTSPLIIIDGVQRDDVNSTYGGAFNNIDPEDIASISLLKDASATAVYGAKAGNGVLIITTKRGVAGKPKISLKAESGISGLTKTPEMLDAVTYMKLFNEAKVNMGDPKTYTDETIQKTASGLDPYLYPNVNWLKTIYKNWAPLYNANMNISGGGEAMRYFVSASFYDQDGSYKVAKLNGYNPNLNFKRYDFRSNVDINISKTTLLQLNLDAMLVNSRYPGISASSLWYEAFATNPISFPVKYPDGKWAGPVNNGGNNPFNDVQNGGYSTEFRPTVQSVISLSQKLDVLTKGLTALVRFSFDSYGEFDNSRSGTNDLWYAGSRNPDGSLAYTQTRTGSTYLGYSQSSTGERTMYMEGNINYSRTFGDHSFGALLVYNMRNRIISTAGDATSFIPYRNQSPASRVTYSYKDKYLAEFDAGYTGSENFQPGKRWGFFPSVSAGWVISRENFFDPLASAVHLLKIRASHGVVGNDLLYVNGNWARFGYLTQISSGNSTAFGLNGTSYAGITESILGAPNLTWEHSTKDNIGLEIGLFNKVNIVVDAYRDKRDHILIPRQSISPIGGYSNLSIYANMGEMVNKGLDGSIEYNDKFGKNVTLRLFGNFTYARNKIVFQDEPKRTYAYQQGTGHQFGEFYGYTSQGLFIDQADINKSPTQTFGLVHPGDIKYKDLNGDGTIDSYDASYLGKKAFPDFLYGLGFTVGYKKIDLSLFFQGVTGVSIMANGSAITGFGATGLGVIPFAGMGQYTANIFSNVTNRWTTENPSQHVDYPRLSIASTSDNNYQSSTWWLKSGNYCRLKQASLGYTAYSAGIKKSGLSSLYFYVSGQNLLTFSKFKIWDPELGSNGAKYPPIRTFTFGVRAQF